MARAKAGQKLTVWATRRAQRMMDWSESRLSQMVQHAREAEDFNFKVWDWGKAAEDELARRRPGRKKR